MSHRIDVVPAGLAFEAPDTGRSLLLAAQDAGIELPSSCRNGTCRTCLARVVSGRIVHTIEWPGLSADEKQEGCVLPCVAEARSDVVLDVPHARSLFD